MGLLGIKVFYFKEKNMIKEIQDSGILKDFFGSGWDLEEENIRYITFQYDTTNDNDIRLKNFINKILYNYQLLCENCMFSKKIDRIYLDCEKHGFLDWYKSSNPDHDGSLCKDYKRKI